MSHRTPVAKIVVGRWYWIVGAGYAQAFQQEYTLDRGLSRPQHYRYISFHRLSGGIYDASPQWVLPAGNRTMWRHHRHCARARKLHWILQRPVECPSCGRPWVSFPSVYGCRSGDHWEYQWERLPPPLLTYQRNRLQNLRGEG